MMVSDDVRAAVKARLDSARDNLHRASAAFRYLAPEQMAEQHGESGRTRADIVTGYEQEVMRWEQALDEVSP